MKIIISLLTLSILVGCGQAINTLKKYSNEQDAISYQVKREKEKFALLVNDIKENKLKEGIGKEKFIKIYGKPVIINRIDKEETELIYRDPLKFFDTPKVYLYFDKEDRLIRWKLEEPEQR